MGIPLASVDFALMWFKPAHRISVDAAGFDRLCLDVRIQTWSIVTVVDEKAGPASNDVRVLNRTNTGNCPSIVGYGMEGQIFIPRQRVHHKLLHFRIYMAVSPRPRQPAGNWMRLPEFRTQCLA